ncbi:hypothetical protein EDC94DRAFT_367727 [Helicostylum pulchrum]|nr:hypothetical protein EDC94DRAFT_367727 [Helicostylum pulchrum]
MLICDRGQSYFLYIFFLYPIYIYSHRGFLVRVLLTNKLLNMVFMINGVKHACGACIRGHRVKKCNHKDRPMIPLVKRGRQVSQCNHCRDLRQTNQSHVKCTCAIASTPNPINGCLCEVLLTCTCVASHLQDVQEDGSAYSPSSPSVSCCSTSPKPVELSEAPVELSEAPVELSEAPVELKPDPPVFNNHAFNPTNDDSVSDLFQFLENDLDKYLVKP